MRTTTKNDVVSSSMQILSPVDSKGNVSLATPRDQSRKKQGKSFMVAGVRDSGCKAKVPPKAKRTYFKAVVGLCMREEGSLELEDEYCREEIKEVFRDQEARKSCV